MVSIRWYSGCLKGYLGGAGLHRSPSRNCSDSGFASFQALGSHSRFHGFGVNSLLSTTETLIFVGSSYHARYIGIVSNLQKRWCWWLKVESCFSMNSSGW